MADVVWVGAVRTGWAERAARASLVGPRPWHGNGRGPCAARVVAVQHLDDCGVGVVHARGVAAERDGLQPSLGVHVCGGECGWVGCRA